MPPKDPIFLACDQRHTKNIGNYESFVLGFGISFPVPSEDGDNIEKQETRDRLRTKYEAASAFLQEMMKEAVSEIDSGLGRK
jgi:hypothetical protein